MELGVLLLGYRGRGKFKTIAFCEYDEFCHRVLRKNFGNVPIIKDIKSFDTERFIHEHGRPFIITGASPVSPSRKPDSDKELRMKRVVISGQKCTELFPLLNLSGSLAKMSEGLLHFQWYSRERLLTWKHQAIRQSVSIFQLAPQTLNTKDNDFGLLPTPRVADTEGGLVKNVELKDGSFSRVNKEGVRWGVKLKDAVNYLETEKTWMTPTARDYKDSGNISDWEENRERVSLPRQVYKRMSPKPTASESLNPELGGKLSDGLSDRMDESEFGVPRVTTEKQDRAARLKAIGNAVIPTIPEIIARAIIEAEGA